MSRTKCAQRKVVATLLAACPVTAIVLLPAHASAQRVLGLDTSSAANSVAPSQALWDKAYNAGYRFAFVRSSRGGLDATTQARLDDGQFYDNISRATAAGIYTGSYHFMRADLTHGGAVDAAHYLERAAMYMKPGYLLPVADLESGATQHTAASLTTWAFDFINTIEAAQGITPIVYQNTSYANDEVTKSLAFTGTSPRTHLWLARPGGNIATAQPIGTSLYADPYGMWDPAFTTRGANPIDPPVKPWSFWQNGSNSSLGFLVDYNAANGNVEFVKDFLVPALWTTAGDGDWNTLSSWNSDNPGYVAGSAATGPAPRLPNSLDWVRLQKSGGGAVTISAGDQHVRKFYTQQPLNITGGSLNVDYIPGSGGKFDVPAELAAAVTVSPGAAYAAHTTQIDANGGQLNLNGGTITLNKIDIASHATTPGKLNFSGDVTLTLPEYSPRATIRSTGTATMAGYVSLGDTPHTLTINNEVMARVDVDVQAPIKGTARLIKAGAGTLQLSAKNEYTGGTTVTGGAIRFTRDENLGPLPSPQANNIILDGGTLQSGAELTSVKLDDPGAGFSSFPFVEINGAGPDIETPGVNVLAKLTSIQVTNGGSGYTGPGGAAVRFVGGGGSGATATATVVGGVVTAINVVNQGSGYTSMPSVYITPGPGSGISGTGAAAIVNGITLTGMRLDSPGFDYANPQINLVGGNPFAPAVVVTTASTDIATSTGRGLLLGAGGGTIYEASGATLTFAGIISGAGAFNKTGPGTLLLTNNNSNSGPVTVKEGTLTIAFGASLGDASAANTLTLDGGALRVTSGLDDGTRRQINIGPAGGGFDSNGKNPVFGKVVGEGSFSKLGGGTLNVPEVRVGGYLGVYGGKLLPAANATTTAYDFYFQDDGAFDLGHGRMILTDPIATGVDDGASYTGAMAALAAGYNKGAWNGAGIMTSETLPSSMGICIARAANANLTSFGGVEVSPTDALIMISYAGDSDLSGRIDGDDYWQVDAHFGETDGAVINFSAGDFNFDGKIDADDYAVIDAGFSGQGAPINIGGAAAGVAAVPEPSCAVALGAGAAAAMIRRRRRNS